MSAKTAQYVTGDTIERESSERNEGKGFLNGHNTPQGAARRGVLQAFEIQPPNRKPGVD